MSKYREVVINACFGGFSLSKKAIARMAELQGRTAYFFTNAPRNLHEYISITVDSDDDLFFMAFDIPNPNEVLADRQDWHEMSDDEKKVSNALYWKHSFGWGRGIKRDDPLLLRVVKELGNAANGSVAKLKIVKIPIDVKWHIEEYDGNEHIAEDHEVWS